MDAQSMMRRGAQSLTGHVSLLSVRAAPHSARTFTIAKGSGRSNTISGTSLDTYNTDGVALVRAGPNFDDTNNNGG